MSWLYFEVDHIVPGTTAVAFAPALQHLSYVPSVLDQWHSDQLRRCRTATNAIAAGHSAEDLDELPHTRISATSGDRVIQLLKNPEIVQKIATHIYWKLRGTLCDRLADCLDEGFESLVEMKEETSKTTHPAGVTSHCSLSHLSLVGLHKQVLATAARLYVHQLVNHENSVVGPWKQKFKALREHHLVEMESLLASTTSHLSPSGGSSAHGTANRPPPATRGGGQVVVNSNHLQTMVDRHEKQLKGAQEKLTLVILESTEKARKDFCSFLEIAAMDVSKTLLGGTGSTSSSESAGLLHSPRSSGFAKKEEDPNSIDSFFDERIRFPDEGEGDDGLLAEFLPPTAPAEERVNICNVLYRKIPNPYLGIQQGGQLKSKDPLISPVALGFSKFSDFLNCSTLYTKADDTRGVKKVEAHLERLTNGRNGGVFFVGNAGSHSRFKRAHTRHSLELLSHDAGNGTEGFLVRDRKVIKSSTTNMWCGTKQWFVDPSRSELTELAGKRLGRYIDGSHRTERKEETDTGDESSTDNIIPPKAAEGYNQTLPDDQAQEFYTEMFSSVINDAISSNCDHLSIVLLPDSSPHSTEGEDFKKQSGKSYIFTPLLHGLVAAVAQAQLALGGGRQAVTAALGAKFLASEPKPVSSNLVWWSCAPMMTTVREASPSLDAAENSSFSSTGNEPLYYSKQLRHNFNTAIRMRVFLPDKAFGLVDSLFPSAEKLN